MQTEQTKNNRLGGILTGIGITALVLPILIVPILSVWLINFYLTVSFVSLGFAYLFVFVKKDRHTLVLIAGGFIGLCFLLIGLIFFSQLFFSLVLI